MAPQVLHNNRVKFPKDILMHSSVHQHDRRDVRCKTSIVLAQHGRLITRVQLKNIQLNMTEVSWLKSTFFNSENDERLTLFPVVHSVDTR